MNKSKTLRFILAFIAGSLMVLALAPYFLWSMGAVGIFSFSTLLLYCQKQGYSSRSLFWLVWLFGFGYFCFGLYWISYGIWAEKSVLNIFVQLAFLFLPMSLALFWSIPVTFAYKIIQHFSHIKNSKTMTSQWGFAISLGLYALAFGLGEMLRGLLFTGFPWNPIGHILGENALAFLGKQSLFVSSFVTFLFYSTPAFVFFANKSILSKAVFLALCFVSAGLIFYESIEKNNATHAPATGLYVKQNDTEQDIIIHLIQPGIPQKEKWAAQYKDRNFFHLLNLTTQSLEAVKKKDKTLPQLIIWPEASSPYSLTHQNPALEALKEILRPNTILVAGLLRSDYADNGTIRSYNSIIAFDGTGNIIDIYDKNHLVPVGEYLPFKTYFEALGFHSLTIEVPGFEKGQEYKTITLPDPYPDIVPMICYEAIFRHFGKQLVKPDHLQQKNRIALQVTNDGWFGSSNGPYQHLFHSQVKAAELGIPLLRSGYTGISVAIDKKGEYDKAKALALGVSGNLRYRYSHGQFLNYPNH